MKRNPMTPEGHASLKKELRHLEEVARYAIVKDIEEARAHGDISENAEFEDAKNRQALNEGRIQYLKSALGLAEIINAAEKKPPEGVEATVIFGCTVILEDEEGEELKYKIVGVDEADLKQSKISYKSPLGRAIIGKTEGEEVKFMAPKGERFFEVIEIQYD